MLDTQSDGSLLASKSVEQTEILIPEASNASYKTKVMDPGYKKFLKTHCAPFLSCENFGSTVVSFFPIISWLPNYNFREDLVHDIIGGFTVGVMHVPQGIAYAILSGVDPVIGLYTSLFQAFVYMFFGTSRHNSIGSSAICSLMTGLAVKELMESQGTIVDGAGLDSSYGNGSLPGDKTSNVVTPLAITTTITFCIGIIEFFMAFLRLDFIASYFSDQLVTGFMTGASVHVLIAQFKNLFDIKGLQPRNATYFQAFLRTYDLFANILYANWQTVVVSALSIAFLCMGKEFLNPVIKKHWKLSVPIPFELILVIITTIVSYFCLSAGWSNVKVVQKVPTGFPTPRVPHFNLISPELFIQAFGIAMVNVALHISIAKMFSKKFKYSVDSRQELYGISFSALAAGFFPVYPASSALARSLVNVESGSRTLLSNLFSSLLLVSVIAYFAQWLQTLPMCVLSAVIVVALRKTLLKFMELPDLWRLSKLDFSVWIVSFTVTVCWNVMPGLGISIVYALFTAIIRMQWSHWQMVDGQENTSTNPLRQDTKMFRFESPLVFLNMERFKTCVEKALAQSYSSCSRDSSIKRFIIDCSGISFVDVMGINAFKEVYLDLKEKEIETYFVGANDSVNAMFHSSGLFKTVPESCVIRSLSELV
ncbi:hypothetical protein L596_021453 [Steinernema carpocapsae]|uniref:STAS domain-containing protein n=1 Tax=Steinernema carpocapsae TaxID=34508 RepID=A0A4U5MJ60_STECR|nr:hypothetical protein L596_021453 [Steinernema carpocapsae]